MSAKKQVIAYKLNLVVSSDTDLDALDQAVRTALEHVAKPLGAVFRCDRVTSDPQPVTLPDRIGEELRVRLLGELLNVSKESVSKALASSDQQAWEELLAESERQRGRGHADVTVVT